MTNIEYCLFLSDGNTWRITSNGSSVGWVGDLATIMQLRACPSGHRLNDALKIIFFCRETLECGESQAIDILRSKGIKNSKTYLSSLDLYTVKIWRHKGRQDVICEVNNNEGEEIQIVNMWYSLLPIYQQSISKGGLPFHAGLAELDGHGILLAAPGDTGKSTCCRRLPEYWRPWCDDEVLVVLDKQKTYRAHPFPTWSDYLWKQSRRTWNVQNSVQLSAVFFLEQSDADELISIGEGEAAVLMTESATQVCEKFWRGADKEDQKRFRKELFNNACEIAKKIPAYRLRVRLDGKFWEKIEQVLGRLTDDEDT
jgi:SynChlorMet cassette protein ScmC